MQKISIIGLGWIGLPLAKILQEKGHQVSGSTTTAEKANLLLKERIHTIQFSLDPYPSGLGFQQLFKSETLVINIPPRSRYDGGEKYLEQLKFLKDLLSSSAIKKVVYVSSTGVYPDENKESSYTEHDTLNLENTGNPNLWKAEKYLQENLSQKLSIIRFGGLLGDDRIPGKYFSGKENVTGHTGVNFIYRLDAARLIAYVIENELWGETINGVAPMHPRRKEIYEKNARELGIAPPLSYAPEKENDQRIISGEKILEMGFDFLYPDPLDFPYSYPNQ
jgi:nucleoside-diphosphate-sugar epimerase